MDCFVLRLWLLTKSRAHIIYIKKEKFFLIWFNDQYNSYVYGVSIFNNSLIKMNKKSYDCEARTCELSEQFNPRHLKISITKLTLTL